MHSKTNDSILTHGSILNSWFYIKTHDSILNSIMTLNSIKTDSANGSDSILKVKDNKMSNNNEHSNYKKGLKVRTEVMGEAHVKRSLDAATAFTQPLQDWIIEHAWGTTWQDDSVLPRKYRSLVTLGFLIAQKSPNELKGHIRGAINNGATVAEIREVLMHSLPYCGAPATQEAFRAAIEVFNEMGIDIDNLNKKP